MLRLHRFVILAAALLAGCDMLGIETASAAAAKREAEGKAIGGACRHAGRAIEDCYLLNRRVDKGAVFAGWREMNDYMREYRIVEVAPQLPASIQSAATPADVAPADEAADDTHGKKKKGS